MLCRYAQQEAARGVRVVAQNAHFVAVVPYWASWPFEVLVLSLVRLRPLQLYSCPKLIEVYRHMQRRCFN
jgi:UDPglucose--hexose-1-phosphate uridylyltransferase